MFGRQIVAAVIGVACLSSTAFAAAPNHPAGVNARERRQAQRIREGIKDGQITRAEADKLKADEAAVRAEDRVYRRSGKGLNKAEYKDLEKDLNRTSREIYRARHNNHSPQPAPTQ